LFFSLKKKTVEMVSELCCDHRFMFIIITFFSLQASTDAYKDMHLRFAIDLSIFVVDVYFSMVCQGNWYFSLCFFQRSDGFFCSSYFSGI